MTRITHRSIQESTLANLQRNLSAMNTLQEQLSTQKRINRPSDDPTGTVNVLTLRADLRATEQHRRNADDAIGWLTTAERALDTTSERLRRVQTLTLQALNSGAQSPAGLQAIAVEIRGIRDDVLQQANQQYLGRSVFAGTSGSAAVIAPGGTLPDGTTAAGYTWTDVPGVGVARQINGNATVDVDTKGRLVFGEDEDSVFAVLDRIAAAVVAPGQPGLGDLKTELDAQYDIVTRALTGLGARNGRVADAHPAADARTLSLTTSLSEVESIDLPATIVQLQSQEVAYKAALGATAKVLQPSLMDFLR